MILGISDRMADMVTGVIEHEFFHVIYRGIDYRHVHLYGQQHTSTVNSVVVSGIINVLGLQSISSSSNDENRGTQDENTGSSILNLSISIITIAAY